MAIILQFPYCEQRDFQRLSSGRRAFVEHLLQIRPDYRYQGSGLPKLKPAPAPGLASAIAAAKIMSWCSTEGATG